MDGEGTTLAPREQRGKIFVSLFFLPILFSDDVVFNASVLNSGDG